MLKSPFLPTGLFVRVSVLAVLALVALAPGNLWAQDSSDLGDVPLDTGPVGLPAASEPDTVRTNIYLTEALMAEIVASTAQVLPAPPAAIQLTEAELAQGDQGVGPENQIFQAAVVRVLGALGYETFLGDEDPARQAAVDCIYSYSVHGVELVYPEVGRTLGLWRRWIDREVKVTVQVDVTMANSGRLLLSDRIERKFSDRVSNDDFELVDSQLYDFTSADVKESGWKGRMEEIIVLGTLAGLVAVYFANTGN